MSPAPARARSIPMAAVVLLLLALSSRADAEPTPHSPAKTILLVDAGDDLTSKRMTAELGALGFEVQTIQRPLGGGGDAEIELLSRTVEAVATIGIDRSSGEVRVWTVDHASGRILLRAVVAIEQDPAVVALRAVEALRTSLNDLQSLPPADTARARAPDAPDVDRPPAVAPRGPSALDVSLGPALAGSPGNSGVSWQGLVSLHWLLRPRWGVEAIGLVPITHASWTENEGSASLTFGLVAAEGHWRPLAMSWCLLDLGAGIGAALVHTEGSPSAGFSGRRNDTLVATPLVRMGYAVSIAWSLWLRADVASAVAIPRPIFAFADRKAGSWGQPLVFGSLGMEIVLR
jgi:hypothetical protein